MEAARAGNEVIVQILINAGANEGLRDKVKMPFCIHVVQGYRSDSGFTLVRSVTVR
jgi:hypothetical protein